MLRMPEFVGETPANRGVWISLMGYCCDLENSGRIAGSRRWKSRMWEQSCGVSVVELSTELRRLSRTAKKHFHFR
jgi:hypothetical protein